MMKTVRAALPCIALLFAFPACDSHSWEDSEDGREPGTKHLDKPHGAHGDGDADKGDHTGEKDKSE